MYPGPVPTSATTMPGAIASDATSSRGFCCRSRPGSVIPRAIRLRASGVA